MKFLLKSLGILGLILFANVSNCMNCKTVANNSRYVGRTTTTTCKEKNGCSSEKTTFKNGSSIKITNCPPAKKK